MAIRRSVNDKKKDKQAFLQQQRAERQRFLHEQRNRDFQMRMKLEASLKELAQLDRQKDVELKKRLEMLNSHEKMKK